MTADLLRFLAKRGRLEVVEYLQSSGTRGRTINEISRGIGIPLATTWHAVHDLANLGLVLIDRIGNAAVVKTNETSPAWKPVRALLNLDLTGPHQRAYEYFARRLLTRMPRVGISLFGSVSRNKHRPSSDVDVEVNYGGTGHDRDAVQAACNKAANEALDRFRIPVIPIVNRRSKFGSS